MIERKVKRQVTIHGKDPEDFDRKVNEILMNHSDVKIEREPQVAMMCYMTFTDMVEIPETLREEYLLAGSSLECRDCPMLRKSEDKRRKKHFCPVKQATVRLNMKCCEEFYEKVEAGEIIIERREGLEVA